MGDGYMSLELINMILKNYCNCVGMAGVRGAFEGVPYCVIVRRTVSMDLNSVGRWQLVTFQSDVFLIL